MVDQPVAMLLSCRDIEYKELPLSLDQIAVSKSQFSCRNLMSTSQETRKATKPRSNKMKMKLRTTPYPQQVFFPPPSEQSCSYINRDYSL